MNDDEIYAEAQRRIRECREKGKKKLDLSEFYRLTAIPPEVADLHGLAELKIRNINVEELPASWGKMTSLRVLDLECRQLKTLPDSFANLTKLKRLRLNYCNFSAVPDFIDAWTALEDLEMIMENTFEGPYTALHAMPKKIGNLRKLKRVVLEGATIGTIPVSLGNCPLELLVLHGSYKTIPATFGNLSRLQTLKLFTNKPLTLPDSFGNLASLKELEIRAPALAIPAPFGKLAALEDLDIDTGNDLVLPKTLGRLSALRELGINASKMRSLPASIGACSNLQRVYLASDTLTKLPESFWRLRKLNELHLDTFALQSLPAGIGSLTALKRIDIFSGALTALPESMGNLKKIQCLSIDAHNVTQLPPSFKRLSYIKDRYIKIGKKEPLLQDTDRSKKTGLVGFPELAAMGYQYQWKFVETLSRKELEALLRSAPSRFNASEDDRDLFKKIMLQRRKILNWKFKWTDEHKKRVVEVSDAFIQAWENGFAQAQKMIAVLEPAQDEYDIEIILYPEFTYVDKLDNIELDNAIASHLNAEFALSMHFRYDPLTKNENEFRESPFIKRDLSWNIEGFGDIELEGHYICYALHVLYSHNEWANADILRINNIYTEIRVYN